MSTSPFRAFRQTTLQSPEPPIRAELFSVERLEQHAEKFGGGAAHPSDPKQGSPLAKRLYNNARVLDGRLSRHRQDKFGASAARLRRRDGLLDNFHIVDEQIREIKDDLPPGYYRLLPKLADGPLQGYPRVSGIAWALVAHTDSAFDTQKLTRFVEAYQRVQPLTIGELWALAITLRITLVENLRRLAEAIMAQHAESQLADTLADQILGADKNDPEPASTILPSLDQAPWSTSFAVELCQRLRDHDPNITLALRWLNDRLGAEGTTTDQIVREEFQRLISVRTFSRVLVRKWALPIHDLRVPNGCSTVCRRTSMASGIRSSRACILSSTSSCSQRLSRLSLSGVHRGLSGQVKQAVRWR